ncbi:MAG: TonB-dependent receptor plug domain-containing protein [Tannerella sp.]|jgi:TonB-dependent SusC/RagA subfamily outer membrane receptor|nr:TonB-dependent receptor plug domain-containing protein [Tannerella sp.]
MKTNFKLSCILLGFLLSIGGLSAQSLTGKVVDSKTGEPVVGAAVLYGNNGEITNDKGEFTVNKSDVKAGLDVRYLGYKNRQVDLAGQVDNLIIRLEEDEKTLDEVVVVGYGKTTRRKQTGNVSTITSEVLAQYTGNSVLDVLQGRVAGLAIAKSNGLAGSTTSINIRGLNTPSGAVGLSGGHACCGGGEPVVNTEPLIIIDGIPFINQSISPLELGAVGTIGPLATLSTSDIERIDVLKDADATAIYGSRGTNGVILITTKKNLD